MNLRARISPVALGVWFLLAAGGCTGGMSSGAAPVIHTYFVAADEVDWDYAPSATNNITGTAFTRNGGAIYGTCARSSGAGVANVDLP